MAANLPTPGDDFDEGEPISGINVTPFVDVVLVLLVIFMVTAPALMKDAIGIKLPKATQGDQKTVSTFGVAITRQGQILLNGENMTLEDLKARSALAVQENKETQAVISADTEAKHGDVVQVIDALKSSGLHRFGLQIQKN
jgi:biopolymer transport protein ExbD